MCHCCSHTIRELFFLEIVHKMSELEVYKHKRHRVHVALQFKHHFEVMHHIYFVLVLIFRTGLACGFHISTSLASLIFFSDCISLTVVVVIGGLPFTCCKENKIMTLFFYS